MVKLRKIMKINGKIYYLNMETTKSLINEVGPNVTIECGDCHNKEDIFYFRFANKFVCCSCIEKYHDDYNGDDKKYIVDVDTEIGLSIGPNIQYFTIEELKAKSKNEDLKTSSKNEIKN